MKKVIVMGSLGAVVTVGLLIAGVLVDTNISASTKLQEIAFVIGVPTFCLFMLGPMSIDAFGDD
jgi:hypothetical protein